MSAAIHHISSDSSHIIAGALSPEQTKVVAALAQGATVTRAAADAGLHRTTIHHWLRTSPEFKAAVDQAKRHYAAGVADSLLELSALALETLQKIMKDEKAPPSVRIKAAMAVLERPRFPNPGWQLPAETGSARERELMQELAAIEADYKRLRMIDAVEKAPPAAASADAPPRSAPCPCGSGIKYKRCCGINAPPRVSPSGHP